MRGADLSSLYYCGVCIELYCQTMYEILVGRRQIVEERETQFEKTEAAFCDSDEKLPMRHNVYETRIDRFCLVPFVDRVSDCRPMGIVN